MLLSAQDVWQRQSINQAPTTILHVGKLFCMVPNTVSLIISTPKAGPSLCCMVQSHRAPSSRRSLKVCTEFTTMVLANACLFLNFDCLRQKMQAFPLHVYYKANPSDGIWVPCNGTISPRAQTQTGPSERALVSSLLYLPPARADLYLSLHRQASN